MATLFVINLGLEKDYEAWINDLIKVLTFRTVQNVLTNYANGTPNKMLDKKWVQDTIFILLGFSVYHLVVKKLIKVSNNKNEKFINY